MKVFVLIATFILGPMAETITYAEEAHGEPRAKVIPLKEIWAYRMPGTRDVRELEPNKFGDALGDRNGAEQLRAAEQSLTSEILSHLQSHKRGQNGMRGFAVAGVGADALRGAYEVIVEGRKPRESFPVGSKLSVVFFSHPFNYYVQLHAVEQKSSTVTIRYYFVPHRTKEMTVNFALIPLLAVPSGHIESEIVRSPMQRKFIAAGFKSPEAGTDARVVAQSFSFLVEDPD
jgi:hypothetical protein